jgi:PAS domain S-box-containing protein
MLEIMTGKKSNLEKALYSRIYYTRGVAAYVALNPNISNAEFAELSKEFIKKDTVISTMALSKNCIINAIYPKEGHQAAIGLNLLDHPERKEMVEKTIQTQLTFVAGPVELVEGGTAFISYTPIFDKTKSLENKFWGLTDIVIKKNSLLNEAGINTSDANYDYALRGVNGTGSKGALFWGDDTVFANSPVTINIELPIGNWELAAIPKKGWKSYPDQDRTLFIIMLVSAFFISLLIWLFSKALLKLKNSEKELKAVFDSLDSLIIEFNITGDYLNVNSENKKLLVLPEREMIGKNLSDIFDKEKAEFFKSAILKCATSRKLHVIEYPLQIENEERWFTARLSYKNENAVIFNAYDITEKKEQNERLIQSEIELKKLNETKNKFFSIIAHDLRGPLGTHQSILKLFHDNYEGLDEETRKNLISSLKDSTDNLYKLLQNLLNWAMSQSGEIAVEKKKLNLNKISAAMFSQFQKSAQLKNIAFINKLDKEAEVFTDKNLTATILRNLITNAIKFTNKGGEVHVHSEQKRRNGQLFLKVIVSDTGIGISQKRQETLFQLDVTQSTPGTEKEMGNGLGLILCKEFAEKLDSEITVESTSGKGSSFAFELPLV